MERKGSGKKRHGSAGSTNSSTKQCEFDKTVSTTEIQPEGVGSV